MANHCIVSHLYFFHPLVQVLQWLLTARVHTRQGPMSMDLLLVLRMGKSQALKDLWLWELHPKTRQNYWGGTVLSFKMLKTRMGPLLGKILWFPPRQLQCQSLHKQLLLRLHGLLHLPVLRCPHHLFLLVLNKRILSFGSFSAKLDRGLQGWAIAGIPLSLEPVTYCNFVDPFNHALRLRRHCVIKSSSVSEEALKLWKTKDGRCLTLDSYQCMMVFISISAYIGIVIWIYPISNFDFARST